MTPVELYVGFWRPHRRSMWGVLGHVEVFGYTRDQTWFFLDPRAPVTDIIVTHHHDEVEALLSHRFANCAEVWRLSERRTLRVPLLGPFNCVTTVSAVLGVRAYTMRGLRRRLRAIGAERIAQNERPEGRPGGQEGSPARAAHVASGATAHHPADSR